MKVMKLEFQSPQKIDGFALDPQPDWTFDSLLSELNSIQEKLNSNSSNFTKIQSREFPVSQNNGKISKSFVMHISDDEIDNNEEEIHNQIVSTGTRFGCDDLYLSDDSDDESASKIESSLMEPMGLVEGALYETTHEHQINVTEEMRNRISTLEADLINENEKYVFTLKQVEKNTEVKRDMDRKLDLQYQRKMAEALDNHLTQVQRDHEHKSQIEERKLRDDFAREEAKKKEKYLQEEKLRQEKLKAEAEMQARLEAERIKSEKAAAEEAKKIAEKKASENIIKGADNALKLEEMRLKIYNEIAKQNDALGLGTNEVYRNHKNQIYRRIKTISCSEQNMRERIDELTKLISNSSHPQSIGIALFAERFVHHSSQETSISTLYAYGRVIVGVTSKIPQAMDIFIAELNKVCIFTVPKYIRYLEAVFESNEAHNKAIGYKVENEKVESKESYIERMTRYMNLYGAIVQTEIQGVQNLHGINEGWAWLARFLNSVPANLYTAIALYAFLEVAGYALYKRYNTQFIKLLNTIEHEFIKALQGLKNDQKLVVVIESIQTYIQTRKFIEEPQGRQVQTTLNSHNFVPDSSGYEEQYYHSNDNYHNTSNYYNNNNNNYNNNNYYNSNRRY